MRQTAAVAILSCIYALISTPVFSQDAFLTIFYSDENAEDVRYFITPAEDGSYNLAKKFRLAPDLDGYVRLRIKLKKPGFVYTSGVSHPLTIYVAPGKSVNVRVLKVDQFGGELRNENAFVNTRFWSNDSTYNRSWFQSELAGTQSALAFRKAVVGLIDDQNHAVTTTARHQRKIPTKLQRFLTKSYSLQILCIADSMISERLAGMHYAGTTDTAYNEWKQLREDLFVDSLINCGLMASKDYSEYLLRYMNYAAATQSGAELSGLDKYMQLTEERLRGPAKEAYLSMFISSNITPGAPFYTRDLILFYEKFKKEFPNSAAIPVLEPEMKRIAKVPIGVKK